jgi:flagellar hook-length control protein FliK
VLKAQTAATEASAAGTDKVPTTTATEGDETFAALIATATPTDGKTGAKKAVTTDATAKTDTKTKADDKTGVATTTAAQPTDATTAPQKTSGDATTDNVSADGAKPDATAVTADAAKPAPSKAHEQAPDQNAKAATPDLGVQINNNIPQTQLQPTSTAAAPTPQLTAKVADGTAVPLNGVAVEIAQSAKAGKSSFDIRLDPAELGRIDVRLEVDKHGNVTSHLTVEKPETLTMLRQDAPQLQRALEQAGLKTNDGGMQFSLRDQSSGQQQQNGDNSGRNAHRLIISEDESLPAVPAGRGYGRMLGSSTGVDISI